MCGEPNGKIKNSCVSLVMTILTAPQPALRSAADGYRLRTRRRGCRAEAAEGLERNVLVPLFVSGTVGAALIYGTFSLPPFGIANTPVHQHTAPHYLQKSIDETTVVSEIGEQ